MQLQSLSGKRWEETKLVLEVASVPSGAHRCFSMATHGYVQFSAVCSSPTLCSELVSVQVSGLLSHHQSSQQALHANTMLGSERKYPLFTARESGSPCSSRRQVPLRGVKMLEQPSSFKQIHLECLEFLSLQELAQFRATLCMNNMAFGGQET